MKITIQMDDPVVESVLQCVSNLDRKLARNALETAMKYVYAVSIPVIWASQSRSLADDSGSPLASFVQTSCPQS
jgi:hypothetical protein